MSLTTDPNDPRICRGGEDKEPRPQCEVYLVLSEEERKKGFVRPVRQSYKHVGLRGPKYPLRDLTDQEKERFGQFGYVKYEEYPEDEEACVGKYWTQEELNKVNKGCGVVTTMALALAETYARQPSFYGLTYCTHCQKHLPVAEFVWDGTNIIVGT